MPWGIPSTIEAELDRIRATGEVRKLRCVVKKTIADGVKGLREGDIGYFYFVTWNVHCVLKHELSEHYVWYNDHRLETSRIEVRPRSC